MSGRKEITAKYQWMMVADPLLCGPGPILSRLRGCDRSDRGDACVCRFNINEIADDLGEIDATVVLDWFEDDVDADDVGQLVVEFAHEVTRAETAGHADAAVERAHRWLSRFRDLGTAGSGLTGRYSEEIDD